jgi:hypothetical protein
MNWPDARGLPVAARLVRSRTKTSSEAIGGGAGMVGRESIPALS